MIFACQENSIVPDFFPDFLVSLILEGTLTVFLPKIFSFIMCGASERKEK